MVLVGTAKHHEIRAFNEEIGFFVALWRIELSVVYLFADCCDSRFTSQSVVAIQAVIR